MKNIALWSIWILIITATYTLSPTIGWVVGVPSALILTRSTS